MSTQALNPDDFHYAGFWIRVVASLIDTVILCVFLVPIFFLFGHAAPLPFGSYNIAYELPGFWDFVATKLMPAAYAVAFWHWRSATPGKSLLGLRVVDAKNGQPPGVGQSIGRYLAYFISALALGLGFVWIAIDRRKQGWHDKLAGTVVVRSKEQGTQKVAFS